MDQSLSRRLYCFIESYESEITTALTSTVSLCLIRLYFNNTESKNFTRLTKKQEKKLKKAEKRISQVLKLSKSKVVNSKYIVVNEVVKLRGGASITPKIIATKVALIVVNGIKDGSVHAIVLLISCRLYPNIEKAIKTICLGGNTDAIVNEIANNLHANRQAIIGQLLTNEEIRHNFNNILLELELIKKPLTQRELFGLALYSIKVLEVPFVKGAIIGARGVMLMLITNKVRQIIVHEFSREIAKGVLVGILSTLNIGAAESVCDIDLTEIKKMKEVMTKSPLSLPGTKIKAPEGPFESNILPPIFNDEIIDFIEIDPVVERLRGSLVIPFSSKFNVDYVIERLVMGHDISKLPIDHITNLW